MQRLFIVILFIIFGKAAQTQRPKTGDWYTLNLPVNFSKYWQWHNDASYRTLGTSVDPLQYLYRTGIRYNFNQQLSTSAGFAFFFSKTDFDKTHSEFGKEFRFWEELNQQHSLNSKWQVLLRLRLEQRFFDATSKKEKYTAHRFRFRAGLNYRLNDKWSLQLADEYMQQLTKSKFSFDQNRIISSFAYHLNKTTQLHAGYMWLKWPDANQHIVTISFTKTISLHDN